MKLSSLLLVVFTLLSLSTIAQTHPTIESVSVNYRIPAIVDTSNSGSMKVLLEATIKLFSTDSISKIHCKVVDVTSHNIVYEIHYSINNGDIIGDDGKILFSKSNTTLYVNGTTILPLEAYSYELTTEDREGNLSSIFSEIH